MRSEPAHRPTYASGGLHCPYCGYDLRAHVAASERAGRRQSRCSECGRSVQHEQLVDNLPLLCERRSPLLAFFLVPLDLLQLFFPRIPLTRRAPLASRPARPMRVLLLGIPLWLFSAGLLCVLVSILARVTFVPGCLPTRGDPFTADAMAGVGQFVLWHPDALWSVALFATAFGIAALVLALSLRRLHPCRGELAVQSSKVHALRRTVYALSPVFALLLLGAGFALMVLAQQAYTIDEDFGAWASEGSSLPCFLALLPALFLLRLVRAGYADGGRRGVREYVGCGLLAIGAWFLWIVVLGGLLVQKNLGSILHTLYFKW